MKREATRRQAERHCELRMFTETTEWRSERIGDDVAEGLVALARADGVVCAQVLNADYGKHS